MIYFNLIFFSRNFLCAIWRCIVSVSEESLLPGCEFSAIHRQWSDACFLLSVCDSPVVITWYTLYRTTAYFHYYTHTHTHTHTHLVITWHTHTHTHTHTTLTFPLRDILRKVSFLLPYLSRFSNVTKYSLILSNDFSFLTWITLHPQFFIYSQHFLWFTSQILEIIFFTLQWFTMRLCMVPSNDNIYFKKRITGIASFISPSQKITLSELFFLFKIIN